MKDVFFKFAPSGEMSDMAFLKVAKDLELLDRDLTQIDTDIIFAKVKEKEKRKLGYEQFEHGIEFIAEKKGIPFLDLCFEINKSDGPKFEGTVTEDVRFHGDKSDCAGA